MDRAVVASFLPGTFFNQVSHQQAGTTHEKNHGRKSYVFAEA